MKLTPDDAEIEDTHEGRVSYHLETTSQEVIPQQEGIKSVEPTPKLENFPTSQDVSSRANVCTFSTETQIDGERGRGRGRGRNKDRGRGRGRGRDRGRGRYRDRQRKRERERDQGLQEYPNTFFFLLFSAG